MGKMLLGLIIFLIVLAVIIWLFGKFAPPKIDLQANALKPNPDDELEIYSRGQLEEARERLLKKKAALKNLTELAAVNEQLLKVDQALAKIDIQENGTNAANPPA